MKVLFNFQEVSEAIENGIPPFDPEATKKQRTMHKEAKKKDNKNATTAKEAWNILIRSPDDGGKIKKSIEESKDVFVMRIEELLSFVEAHEMSLVERNPIKNYEQALKATYYRDEDRKKNKKWKGKKSYHNLDGPESPNRRGGPRKNKKQRKYDKRNVECFNCCNIGNYSYKCPSDKGKQMNRQDKEAFTIQEEPESKPLTLMVTTIAENSHHEAWFLDSGCSNHMTSHKEWFIDFDPSRKRKVKFVDDNTLKVEGAGDVVIMMQNGSKALILNVLFVHGMRCNLLSIGQLIQKGFTIVIENGQFKLSDADKRLILRIKLTKNITFYVNIKVVEVQCLTGIKPAEES
ncbi:PREDICTED: uncharacterized protein LOC109336966 [Lupinus angustifolius]|uniref:uncharacterized protein LOC109336966 n=1 Tax=Lupinus angustifolius TaxID=3871 RepID=UPI00092E3FDC|nr:PREDICTED: uncharacterized protein LOC109336966 [Lupinus angustifolius]